MERFPRQRRLLAPEAFRQCFTVGRAIHRSDLLFLTRETDVGYCRLGVSIRRSVCGAVQRNRLRRQIREAFRRNPRGSIVSRDIVVVVKRRSRDLDYWTICQGMDAALRPRHP